MRGRPKRTTDADLTARARVFEQREELSHRQASRRLGIEPSTYSRCLRANAFSEKTASILEQALDREGVPKAGPGSTKMRQQLMMRLLHLFEEGAALLAPFKSAETKYSEREGEE